jgi:large subunit ribosomal protein L23
MAIFTKNEEEKHEGHDHAHLEVDGKKKAAKPEKLKSDTGDAYKILIKPLLTEKLNKQSSRGVVAFKVSPKANKISVAKAVETVYDVKVEKVNMVTMPGKPKNFGRTSSRTSVWKKAIVTLKKGQVIQE